VLSFPDGRREELHFEDEGRSAARTLPRGEIEVRALGAPGLALAVPVVVTRSREVVAPVVTWWSLLALGTAATLALAVLFLAARPRRRQALAGFVRGLGRRWYRPRSPDSAAG
jgi:hypothetical protein